MEKEIKYGIWATRSSFSCLGAASKWCIDNNGKIIAVSRQEAEKLAKKYNDSLSVSSYVCYVASRLPE
jgi:hypothetical protein